MLLSICLIFFQFSLALLISVAYRKKRAIVVNTQSNANLQISITSIGLKKSIEVHFNRSKIFPLYFYDAYDVNLWEKKFGRRTAYLSRANVFIEFYHFMKKKKKDTADTKQLKQKNSNLMGFC